MAEKKAAERTHAELRHDHPHMATAHRGHGGHHYVPDPRCPGKFCIVAEPHHMDDEHPALKSAMPGHGGHSYTYDPHREGKFLMIVPELKKAKR